MGYGKPLDFLKKKNGKKNKEDLLKINLNKS